MLGDASPRHGREGIQGGWFQETILAMQKPIPPAEVDLVGLFHDPRVRTALSVRANGTGVTPDLGQHARTRALWIRIHVLVDHSDGPDAVESEKAFKHGVPGRERIDRALNRLLVIGGVRNPSWRLTPVKPPLLGSFRFFIGNCLIE